MHPWVRLAGTGRINRLIAMVPQACGVLLLAVLVAATPLRAVDHCRALREQRDGFGRQAMQAEIALLHSIRQKLCPQQEAVAMQANALSAAPNDAPRLDYWAYIACRERAEAQLQRSRPVLYRNLLGFTFYTPEGVRSAQQADARSAELERLCP